MSTVTKDYIKQYFPLWDKFFLDAEGDASETILQAELDQAEIHLQEYIIFPEPITDQVKRMVLIITRYFGFMRTQGDVEFKVKPFIVKEYEALIERLEQFKAGEISLLPSTLLRGGAGGEVNAKPRIFDEWFNDPYSD
jgi:hypothetical protein